MQYVTNRPMKYCNLLYAVSALSLSLLSNQTWTQSVLLTEQQAAVYLSGQPYTSDEVRLPSVACGPCAEKPGFLYLAPSLTDRSQGIHPPPRNQKVSVTSSGGIVYRGKVA